MVRLAKRQNPQNRQVSVPVSIPPPTGGWDARSSIAAMPPSNAVILDNWVPRPGLVEMRRGFTPRVTGFAAPIETLIPFRSTAGADLLFAASGGNLYDVSTTGPLGTPVATGATSNRWNYTGFANAAANWTVACNGANDPIGYHAGSWAALPTISGSGLTPSDLFNVFGHKGRLHFLEKGTLHVWNPAAGAVGGVCTLLDLSSIFSKGGALVCGSSWSATIGLLTDEFAVYVTNQGQVAVYQGTDPTSTTAWALINVYDLGPPLGPRALVKLGGDLNVITTDGVIPLSQAIRLDRAEQAEVALTSGIVRAFQASAKAYQANYGWQAILYPGATTSSNPDDIGGSMAIINVPVSSLGTSIQYVQSVLGGGWCRFRDPLSGAGLPSYCWEIQNGNVFFGSASGVYQWDQGSSDNGQPIIGDVLPAFSSYGFAGRNKQFVMVRPLMNCSPLISPALTICVDYNENAPTATPTVISEISTAAEIRFDWTSDGSIGTVGAPYMRVNMVSNLSGAVLGIGDVGGDILGVNAAGDMLGIYPGLPFNVPVQLLGFDLVLQPGGIL